MQASFNGQQRKTVPMLRCPPGKYRIFRASMRSFVYMTVYLDVCSNITINYDSNIFSFITLFQTPNAFDSLVKTRDNNYYVIQDILLAAIN